MTWSGGVTIEERTRLTVDPGLGVGSWRQRRGPALLCSTLGMALAGNGDRFIKNSSVPLMPKGRKL